MNQPTPGPNYLGESGILQGHCSPTLEMNAMALRRSLFAVAFLVALVAPLAAPGAAQNPNKPVVEEVDVTFLAPNLTAQCGTDIYAHVVGTVTFKHQPNGTTLVRFQYDHIFSGPGGSISVNRTENSKIQLTVLPDGTEVEYITTSGTLMYHMVIPGHGSIGNNSGHEILQLTWQFDEASGEWVVIDEQVFFDSGPNNEISEADYEVICSVLT